MVVIPYVENVSEAVARIIRNYNVPVAIKPHKTLKSVLVHPTDKQEKEDKLTECVYKVPCANCDKTYISETGRKFGVRLQEHRTELESKIGRTLTRSLRASSLTDPLSPTTQLKKRTMSSTGLKRRWSIIDSEPERFTRWIKEVIHIRKRRKEGQHAMNADEGSYQLSHAYDRFLDTASSRHVKNRKNWVPASSDESFW